MLFALAHVASAGAERSFHQAGIGDVSDQELQILEPGNPFQPRQSCVGQIDESHVKKVVVAVCTS